jgi:hypothetical protein
LFVELVEVKQASGKQNRNCGGKDEPLAAFHLIPAQIEGGTSIYS